VMHTLDFGFSDDGEHNLHELCYAEISSFTKHTRLNG
jgi:hypothetical protein